MKMKIFHPASCRTALRYAKTIWYWNETWWIQQTSVTEIPRDSNLLAYCLLDLVELFVTNTNFLPYKLKTHLQLWVLPHHNTYMGGDSIIHHSRLFNYKGERININQAYYIYIYMTKAKVWSKQNHQIFVASLTGLKSNIIENGGGGGKEEEKKLLP